MSRLGLAALGELPAAIARPRFDPRGLAIGIVHLGCGAFHRAHQAIYTQAAIAAAPGPWGICGVSLRSAEVRDRLAPQDCLYAVSERGAGGETLTVIGAIREALVAPEDPAAVTARLAAPQTRVISLTVTEKGYCHDPATGRLNEHHPDIVHDLEAPTAPRSTLGYLVAGLDRRMREGRGAPTILCCDNLPHNGAVLAGLVQALAALRSDRLAAWIAANAAFPSTMVDRIVPATSDADRARIAAALGCRDEAAVVCEPFKQWVIEDRFAGPRPAWERAGAELVSDVRPYETMKLRLLNASHSALAYLGYLAGYDYIYQVMENPAFVRYMRRLMDEEVTPTLTLPPSFDLAAYKSGLVERFANPALAHRCYQIAMDGSQKLPQRLLGTLRDQLAAGRPARLLALAVAAWMRYVAGIDELGRPIVVQDPLADRLRAIGETHRSDPAALARAYLGVREVFGEELALLPELDGSIGSWLRRLYRLGAVSTVESI